MRNEIEKFHHTIGVLVSAFINNTLQHSNCYACAVGNMVAAANNHKFIPSVDAGLDCLVWDVTNGEYCQNKYANWVHVISYESDDTIGLKEIESTGYTLEEVKLIEHAFEGAQHSKDQDVWVFNGLMAVVDVLAEIHGIDLTTLEETKKLFVKN